MYSFSLLAALASLAGSWAAPQVIDLDAVAAAPDPVLVTPPLDVQQNVPPSVTPASITPITTPGPGSKRDLGIEKRDGNCATQPTGSGPVPTPDTASAFAADPSYAAIASGAPAPNGYTVVFTNLNGSLSAPNYLGLYTLTSFDTLTCASKCDQVSTCQAFNVYIERDPSVDPNAQQCPNPPSTINYKCTLWGVAVTASEATNTGQWRDSFQVLIAGSNAYNKDAPPPAISGYNGPTELGGAINAPTSSNSYLGYQYFPFSQSQGYDPQTCANACNAQTTYDSQHPAEDGTYQSCIFFDAYVLSENGIPQGLYCSLYNETWAPSYATNYGQYRGSDRYTVSQSYSYSLINPPNSSTPAPCPTEPTIQNGGFETYGVPPPYWNVTDVTGSTTYGDTAGDPGTGSQYSFVVSLQPSAPGGSSGLNLSQPMTLCAGHNYYVEFNYIFHASNDCSLEVVYPYGDSYGSITTPAKTSGIVPGEWNTIAGFFTPGTSPYVLSFIFACANGGSDPGIGLDNVVVHLYPNSKS